jgi:hypothetical protein
MLRSANHCKNSPFPYVVSAPSDSGPSAYADRIETLVRGGNEIQKSVTQISILLSPNLFSSTLLCRSLFKSALRTRFQVVGVTLHFLDDVFRLNLALEPTQGILQRLALMQSNFCQIT